MLRIGNNVGISNSTIFCKNSIIIEDNVLIGANCKIYDSDFHSVDYNDRIEFFINNQIDTKAKTASIHIKRGAWIGGHCIVLKGVTIGEKSIIGAGSVVVKNIPDNEIWAGNPAIFRKKIFD
jgi:acetyltransferase-like isoleucine patch superfamily enzyme